MPVRIDHLIDIASGTQAASWNFQGAPPKRACLYIVSAGAGTLTVEVSPDDGQTLVSYDKLITDAGVDAPAASVTLAAADDVVAISQEDVIDYIRVTVTGAAAAVDVWLVWES